MLTVLLQYPEEALHQLFLLLLAFCTALCQLDDHSHVTCREDGLHALDQLVEQLQELKRTTQEKKNVTQLMTYTLNGVTHSRQ